jgi:hypothetical protein
MTLKKHETPADGAGHLSQYRISGLPPGEHALIGEFSNRGWRILRWNDDWHGNWTGSYSTAQAAIEALKEEISLAVAQ